MMRHGARECSRKRYLLALAPGQVRDARVARETERLIVAECDHVPAGQVISAVVRAKVQALGHLGGDADRASNDYVSFVMGLAQQELEERSGPVKPSR
jgi:hypothetical protein